MCRLSINLKDSGLRKSLIYDKKKKEKENCPITNSIKLKCFLGLYPDESQFSITEYQMSSWIHDKT